MKPKKKKRAKRKQLSKHRRNGFPTKCPSMKNVGARRETICSYCLGSRKVGSTKYRNDNYCLEYSTLC